MKKIVLWILVIAAVAAIGIYYYVFHYGAKHLDPLESKDKVVISAENLFLLYNHNEDSANTLYLDKTISVSGQVKTIEVNDNRYTITLNANDSMGAVICEMDTLENPRLKDIKPNMPATVVGFCNGFLMDVQLDRCKLAK
jgi:hypothetical protein